MPSNNKSANATSDTNDVSSKKSVETSNTYSHSIQSTTNSIKSKTSNLAKKLFKSKSKDGDTKKVENNKKEFTKRNNEATATYMSLKS